jgi:Flp pilus assembly protein protease CpaA
MSQLPFAPNSVFAWFFYLCLVGIMVAASYFDLRKLVIPKQLSVSAFAAGLLINVVRGVWLGGMGQAVWQLGPHGEVVGGIDGLLFGLSGAAIGFVLFLIMFVLGTCGGGDVKQFTALGAWVGPLWAVFLLIGTIVFVVLVSTCVLVYSFFRRGPSKTFKDYSAKEGPARRQGGKQSDEGKLRLTRGRLTGWSVPATLSTLVVLLWLMRGDLQLGPQPAQATANQPLENRLPISLL